MTRLVEALRGLALTGDVAAGGHWIEIQGEHCVVYVVETSGGAQFYTWCDNPVAREIEVYRDATQAITAGLRRAAALRQEAEE